MSDTIYKKIGAGALTSVFLLSVAACGDTSNEDNDNGGADSVGLEDIGDGEAEPRTEEFVEEKAQAFYDSLAEPEPVSDEEFEEVSPDGTDALVELFEDRLGDVVEEYVDTSDLEEGEDMMYLYSALDSMNQILHTSPDNWIHVAEGHTEIEEDVAYISVVPGEAQVDDEYVSDNFASFDDYIENQIIERQRNDVGEMVYVDEEWRVVLQSPQQQQPMPEGTDMGDIGNGDASENTEGTENNEGDQESDEQEEEDNADSSEETEENEES